MPEMPAWAAKPLSGGSLSFITDSRATGPALVASLICIGILARRLYRRNPTKINIQHYQWDDGAAGTAKKRWMWDSLKLLREGYFKVNSIKTVQSLFRHKLLSDSMITPSFMIGLGRSGPRKATKLFYHQHTWTG